MRHYLLIRSALICGTLLLLSGRLSADSFDDLIEKYKKASLIELDVIVVVESSIFDDVDSVAGRILVCADGRYRMELGEDSYIFDGRCIWEYSAENRQATKKCLKDGEIFENRLSFIKNLNKFYDAEIVVPDSIYRLLSVDSTESSLPEEMSLYVSRADLKLIDYFDLNQDLNRIYINRTILTDSIKAGLFEFNPPDSVEIISLP
jgi:outer membrane lipoprotein-sorting protein